MADLINSIRSYDQKSKSSSDEGRINIGSGFSLPNPNSRTTSPVYLNDSNKINNNSQQNISPTSSTTSIRSYNSNNEKKYKDILPNPIKTSPSSSNIQLTSPKNNNLSPSKILSNTTTTTSTTSNINKGSLECISSLLNDLNGSNSGSDLKDYYCKHCDKKFPTFLFKNKEAFNTHLNNCNIKKRKMGDANVPELGSGPNDKFRRLNDGISDYDEMNELYNLPLPFSNNNNSSGNLNNLKGVNSILSINNYSGSGSNNSSTNLVEQDSHRIPSSSPSSSNLNVSPQSSADEQGLRFALLDVIEDKIAEETELEYIRRDFKNIGNEIIIQDMKKEKEIQDLYQLLSSELKETDIRVKEDVIERSKKEELQMKKMKEDLLNQYFEMEKQLKLQIENLNQMVSKQKESKELSHKDDKLKSNNLTKSSENPIQLSGENIEKNNSSSDSELTIDESPEKVKEKEISISEENKEEVNKSEDSTLKSSSSPNNSSNNIVEEKESMKLKISLTKKSNDNESKNNDQLIKKKREDIIKKIEETRKTIMEKIMNYSISLATQGREFDRLVTLESNEYEKHLAKKFSDMKKELNENTDALATSFDIIDNILVNQAQHHQQMNQQQQKQSLYNQIYSQPQPTYSAYNNNNQSSQQQSYYNQQQQSKIQNNKQNYLIK